MKNYLIHDAWRIIEDKFHADLNRNSESVFSLGNGRFGQRANFEEDYTGHTMQGNYVAGVYYPDKTRVGWWKNGYPEYFAKVLNAPNWNGITIEIDGLKLDISKGKLLDFRRELNMKEGYLQRDFTLRMVNNNEVKISATRLLSISDDETAAIRYRITPLNFSGKMTIQPYIDADVMNEDANYDEQFWLPIDREVEGNSAWIIAETKKTAFQVATGMLFDITQDGQDVDLSTYNYPQEKYVGIAADLEAKEGEEIVISKYVGIVSSLNYDQKNLATACKNAYERAANLGFESMKKAQADAWAAKWEGADIVIEGDVAAQQGIRFCIFQMYQTYTGEDERLNIGPKGFTGEKYGGSTYWDTEAYCLPFYLATADQQIARNLLIYRHKHLEKAIENAAKLGFKNGAALYPMVTMNGEECHNEWEITFEEIHRNGAIAYGIYDYIRYSGDKAYLADYGLEVLIGISRFWAQRVHYSSRKGMYVMHGVTGPNEYDNNVNNNWYTNFIAKWCLEYTFGAIQYVKETAPAAWEALEERIKFYEYTETNKWRDIAEKMYLPYDKELGVFEQADGFFDKDWEKTIADLTEEDAPINQNWSWDRILRSVYIKQADVLQGLYFFEERFDEATLRRNFEFYEPRTVHESSLSPCVHAVLAAKLGMEDKAYEMYLRTARLDLDDYNNDTEDGCHITSMAGTWMAFVEGFGGMRAASSHLIFNPTCPKKWQSYTFKVRWRGAILAVKMTQNGGTISNLSERDVMIEIGGNMKTVEAGKAVSV